MREERLRDKGDNDIDAFMHWAQEVDIVTLEHV